MKKVIIVSLMCCGFLAAGSICDLKIQDVQNQINRATAHNRMQEVQGLKKALKELNDHCDDGVELKKIQSEIKKIELKVSEAEQKVLEIKEKGKTNKIKSAEKKVEMLKTELLEKKAELSKMQKL